MKKVASLLLVLAMLFTMLPTGAFAADRAAQGQAALSRLGLMHRGDIAIDRQETDAAQVVSAIIVLEEDRLESDSSAKLLSCQAELQQRISREVLDGQAVQVGYSYTKVTNGFSAVMTYGQLLQVRQLEGVEAAFVAPEFRLSPNMTNSNKMIGGGNGLYNKTGYHGEGMLVAILDTRHGDDPRAVPGRAGAAAPDPGGAAEAAGGERHAVRGHCPQRGGLPAVPQR